MTIAQKSILRATYYRVKPFLPLWLRMGMRRAYAQKLREKNSDTWPIDESAARAPEGWSGWPEGKKFAFVLTHDVESSAGMKNLKKLAELEMGLGLRASFNFVPEGDYVVPSELRSWLVERGFEIGVHDLHHNGRLYDQRDNFRRKAERINSYIAEWGVSGFRSAFMMRELDWIHELDVEYDSSTFDTDPFEPQPDGCGSIFPLWFPNPDAEDSGYVELPYTLAQDSTLFFVLQEKTVDIWKTKLDWLVQQGGLVLINIHPDYVDFESQKFSLRSYPSTLLSEFFSYLTTRYSDEFWNPRPEELSRWFRSKVVKKNAL